MRSYMKKIMITLAVLCVGTLSSYAQGRAPQKDTVQFDKSFEDAGNAPSESHEFHLTPKFYKAGVIAADQPIGLATAKKDAMDLVRAKPTPLRKDCLNLIYTVAPIYSEGDKGNITGALRGTIVIKWDLKRRMWVLSYLKYQLLNIDQNAQVFQLEAE